MNVPNTLTLIRVILIPIFVLFYVFTIPNCDLWMGIVFVAASVTDFFDGYLARKWNQITVFGKFVDPIADKLLVLSALLILMDANSDLVPFWVVLILLAREFIISGFRLVAVSKGVVIAADKSGKLKTVFQMVALALLLFNGLVFGWFGILLGQICLYISVGLSVYSCFEYLIKNRSVFKDDNKPEEK